jgi:succinyl-CoA synthetase alpha subunit
MSIFIDENTRVVVQGIGSQGTFHAKRNQDYGTQIVGGVHPKKGGTTWEELDVPVFATVKEAVAEAGANTSMVMVPAPFTKDAILEAHDAGVQTIITITEGVPVHDMTEVYDTVVRRGGARLIGPNCPGLISPGKSNVGIIPADITMPGRVGLVSRSGTLTYQIMHELAQAGIGISTCVGIGGDPVIGTQFLDVIQAFAEDPDTDAIAFVGRSAAPRNSWRANGSGTTSRTPRSSATSPGSRPPRASRWGTPAPSSRRVAPVGNPPRRRRRSWKASGSPLR